MTVQITDSPLQGSASRHLYEVGASVVEPGSSTAEPGPSTESVTQPRPAKGEQCAHVIIHTLCQGAYSSCLFLYVNLYFSFT